MIQLLLLAVSVVVLIYVAWLAAVWRFQERIVFQPPAGVPPAAVPARQVYYRAADGAELFAYLIGDPAPDRTVIVAFHGNADLARWLVPWASSVARETGAAVMLPEYRGYDGLSGAPSYARSALDAGAAVDYLRDRFGVRPADLVYFGHSLGTAIAAELASACQPRCLVLQAPFSSAKEMAARMVIPGITTFWRVLSRVHFDTVARVRTIDVPVSVSHGDKDLIIPVRMGRAVFAAARRGGDLLIVEGAGHNDVSEVGGKSYWQWLVRAVQPESRQLRPSNNNAIGTLTDSDRT